MSLGLTKTTSMMDFLSDSENHNYCPSETEAPKTKTLALQVKENGTKSPTSITCKVITYLYLLVNSFR